MKRRLIRPHPRRNFVVHLVPSSCQLMLGSLLTVQPFEPLQRTEWQRRHFEQVSAAARLASEKALPELLAALDSRALRERLAKQCVDA